MDENVRTHAAAIRAAGRHRVDVLVFPELSLTGYEPELASGLAMTAEDERLDGLAELAGRRAMDVVVGAPLSNAAGKPGLGAIVLGRDGTRRVYWKMHPGSHEKAFFQLGHEPLLLDEAGTGVGLAICADASEPSHPRDYARKGASVYAAGVFLTAEWYSIDAPRLATHAARFGLLTVMANHGASSGTYESVGRSMIWQPGGALLAQAVGTEGVLLVAESEGGGWRGKVLNLAT